MGFLVLAIVGYFALKSRQIFVSYTKSFLDFERHPSQFLINGFLIKINMDLPLNTFRSTMGSTFPQRHYVTWSTSFPMATTTHRRSGHHLPTLVPDPHANRHGVETGTERWWRHHRGNKRRDDVIQEDIVLQCSKCERGGSEPVFGCSKGCHGYLVTWRHDDNGEHVSR